MCFATWWCLGRLGPHADWLEVEAPTEAVVGQDFPIKVRLTRVSGGGFISTDLHWKSTRDITRGFLASGGSKPLEPNEMTYDFKVPVPQKDELRFVEGVIYLSKTGSWDDNTSVAITELIPVLTNSAANQANPMRRLALQDSSGSRSAHGVPRTLPRFITALLFLAAAGYSWRASGRRTSGLKNGTTWKSSLPIQGDGSWRGILPIYLLLFCVWELFGLEGWVGNHARAIARSEDWYYPRMIFQKAVISLAAVLTAAFVMFLCRTSGSRRVALIGVGLYSGISLINLVSFHAIDQIAEISWHGVMFVQALKLGCAVVILLGLLRTSNEI
jgi:hypothetical protein